MNGPLDLEWVVDNVYTIARREHRRFEDGKALRPEMWAHVLRLCEQAGAQSRTVGVLRADDAVDPVETLTTPDGPRATDSPALSAPPADARIREALESIISDAVGTDHDPLWIV